MRYFAFALFVVKSEIIFVNSIPLYSMIVSYSHEGHLIMHYYVLCNQANAYLGDQPPWSRTANIALGICTCWVRFPCIYYPLLWLLWSVCYLFPAHFGRFGISVP